MGSTCLPPVLGSILFSLILGAFSCFGDPPKVIIDTDFNTIGDDGQVAIMAAQLYAQGAINLFGFTIPSGNQWRDQEVSDCLKAVERLGIEHRVKVYLGAQYSLLHDYNSYLLELMLFGPRKDYVGAYSKTQPEPDDLVPPPDGFATHTQPAEEDAVRFLMADDFEAVLRNIEDWHQGLIAGYRISYRDTQDVEYQIEREGKQVQRSRTRLSWL